MDDFWWDEDDDVPGWAVRSSWMVGVRHGEDHLWTYMGYFAGANKTSVDCSCADDLQAQGETKPPVRLSPIGSTNGRRVYEVCLVGQCAQCGNVLWGKVA